MKLTKEKLDLRTLTETKEWKTLADVYMRLRERWKSQMIQFHTGDTVERIALERVRLSARIEGTEMLFQEIQQIIDDPKEEE
jgi:hypothetical protein